MKIFNTLMLIIAVGLLGLIAYNSSLGKLLPAHHAGAMSCDSLLTQQLFYSSLLEKQDEYKKLIPKIRNAETLETINNLVTSGTNIDAQRSRWYESVSTEGQCEVQIFLQKARSDGNNTAYIGYSISGFVEKGNGISGSMTNSSSLLESIQINLAGTQWQKQN